MGDNATTQPTTPVVPSSGANPTAPPATLHGPGNPVSSTLSDSINNGIAATQKAFEENISHRLASSTDALAKKIEGTGIGIKEDQVKGVFPFLAGALSLGAGVLLLEPINFLTTGALKAASSVLTGFGLFEKIPLIGGAFTAVGAGLTAAASYVSMGIVAAGSFIGYKLFESRPKESTTTNTGNAGNTAGLAGSTVIIAANTSSKEVLPDTRPDAAVEPKPAQKPVKLSQQVTSKNPEVAPDIQEAVDYALRNKPGQDGKTYNSDIELENAANRINNNESLRQKLVREYNDFFKTLKPGEKPPLGKLSELIKSVGSTVNNPVGLGEKVQAKAESAKTVAKTIANNAISKTEEFVTGGARPAAQTAMNGVLMVDGLVHLAHAETPGEKRLAVGETVTGGIGLGAQKVRPLLTEGTRAFKAVSGVAKGTGGILAVAMAVPEYYAMVDSFSKEDATNWDYVQGAGHGANTVGGSLIALGVGAEAFGVGAGLATAGTVFLLPGAVIGTGALAYELGVTSKEALQERAKANAGYDKLKTGDAFTAERDLTNLKDLTATLGMIAKTCDSELTKAGLKKIKGDQVIYDLGTKDKLDKLRNILKQRIADNQKHIDADGSFFRSINPLTYYNWDWLNSHDDTKDKAAMAQTNQAADIGALTTLDKLIEKIVPPKATARAAVEEFLHGDAKTTMDRHKQDLFNNFIQGTAVAADEEFLLTNKWASEEELNTLKVLRVEYTRTHPNVTLQTSETKNKDTLFTPFDSGSLGTLASSAMKIPTRQAQPDKDKIMPQANSVA